jgi:hypothetical protein
LVPQYREWNTEEKYGQPCNIEQSSNEGTTDQPLSISELAFKVAISVAKKSIAPIHVVAIDTFHNKRHSPRPNKKIVRRKKKLQRRKTQLDFFAIFKWCA